MLKLSMNVQKLLHTSRLWAITSLIVAVLLTPLLFSNSTSAQGTTGTTSSTENCDNGGGEFSFIICPFLRDIANPGIESLDNNIRESLNIDKDYYESDEIRNTWANFRNIAYIVLIPVMLVMVIGTALQFSFVDAYTVRRAMPRLLVAVIFMALSYDIMRIMIDVTNEVGRGAAGLIAAPFGGSEALEFQKIFEPNSSEDSLFSGGVLAGIAIGTALGALSLGILATYLAAALLALIIIFAVITMRELIVVFLMVPAPLAIISWIFPGNDALWKLWWNAFSKLLMAGPPIIALLVVGRGFALLIHNANPDPSGIEGVFLVIAKTTAYIGPFFAIILVFQSLSGAVGNLIGRVNDRGKGAFDRMRNYRGNKRKQLFQDAQAGKRFKGSGRVTDRLNNITQGGANLNRAFDNGVMRPRQYHRCIPP